MIMNIKPLADRVLILPAAAEEKTIGGIIIPDTAKEKPLKGEVIAAGEGTKDEKMVLKKGDTVLYGKYAGTEIELDGTKYLIMRQSDVVAVIKNPAFWMIAFLCLLFYAAVNPFLKYSTGMMVGKFGIGETLAGLFPMILPMGCIVLTPLFGGIYDKKGHGADLMILGACLITAVHLVFAILPDGASPVFPIILMVFLGIGFALLPSAMWPSVAKIIPAKQLGTAMALTFYIQNIGFIFVPKAIRAIQAGTEGYFWFSIFFTCLGVSAILLSSGIKLLDKKKRYGLQVPNIQK